MKKIFYTEHKTTFFRLWIKLGFISVSQSPNKPHLSRCGKTQGLYDFIFGFSLILLLISAIALVLPAKKIQEEKIYAKVNVTDSGGFDLNNTALTFGNVQRLGTSTRSISFENKNNFPVAVYASAEGDIKELLDFEKVTKLNSKEKKTIALSVLASEDIEERVYSGNVTFSMFRD